MTAEKRALDKDDLIHNVSSVIVDIEGTTTSISFVHDTLFPFVREHLAEYVKSNWNDSEFQEDLKALKEQAEKDKTDGVDGVVAIPEGKEEEVREALIKNVLWQMDNDRKTGALKQLQGHIWRKGYNDKKIVGHIYDDVHENLKSWVDLGKKIYVYSSGSAEAQKLLFGHTKEGDLLHLFSGNFDTTVGAKTETASYTKILEKIEKTGDNSKTVLFLTDICKEAAAATEAGMLAVLVAREGNAPLTDDAKTTFQVISSFADLSFEGKCKRRKVSEPETVANDNKSDEATADQNDVEMKEADDVCAKKTEDVSQDAGDKTVDANASKQNDDKKVHSEPEEKKCPAKLDEADKKMETDSGNVELKNAEEQECKIKNVEVKENGTAAEEKSDKKEIVETVDDVDKHAEKVDSAVTKSGEKTDKSQNIAEEVSTVEDCKKADEDITKKDEKTEEVKEVEKPKAIDEEKCSESDEKINENGSIKEEDKSESDEKTKESVEKKEEPAKQNVAETNEVNDDSGIADVNKSVNQSTISDDTKTEEALLNGKNAETDEKNEIASKVEEKESESKVEEKESVDKEVVDGKKSEAESKEPVSDDKDGEIKANGECVEAKVNGNKDDKEAGEELKNGVDKSKDSVQNGTAHLKNNKTDEDIKNGDDSKEHDKTDADIKKNGNQKAIDEKKVENTTEAVAV